MLAAELILPSSLIVLGSLGLAFGLLLALAAKAFHVETDPRVALIEGVLPGAQCGACGKPGCSAYAEAVVKGELPPGRCMPGGPDVAAKVAAILGVESSFTPQVAVVRCKGGTRDAKQRAEYHGIVDCAAAELVNGGPKACVYGCLGYGTCVKACSFDALAMSDDRLPVVFEDKCTGCGSCVSVCPRGIIEMVPRSQMVYLACVSKDKAKEVKEVCAVGCTGCKACTTPKRNPSKKLKMVGNLPLVPADWEDFQVAVLKCPAKGFVVREPGLERFGKELEAAAAATGATGEEEAAG
ncbi:MAG: RnfABCDGE type electron transport complex subunit B [Planctomycetes bacterium]|jgi:RnfABCDGE-type electron transport complex B subunit|nr:RnfABCDGE type electron transport complex subunit B [Planctomycetota bacterium]